MPWYTVARKRDICVEKKKYAAAMSLSDVEAANPDVDAGSEKMPNTRVGIGNSVALAEPFLMGRAGSARACRRNNPG
ncbi:hypothetical protein MASR2M74_31920 [Paracoccaceae bacterium]